MKSLVLVCSFLVALCFGAAAVVADEKTDVKPKLPAPGIKGVKGTVWVIDGTKAKDPKITVKHHDMIVLVSSYPINPPLPRSATQKSSDPAVVKGDGISRVVNVGGLLGTGHLGANFTAHKKGKATLTLEVHRGSITSKVTCEVEVK